MDVWLRQGRSAGERGHVWEARSDGSNTDRFFWHMSVFVRVGSQLLPHHTTFVCKETQVQANSVFLTPWLVCDQEAPIICSWTWHQSNTPSLNAISHPVQAMAPGQDVCCLFHHVFFLFWSNWACRSPEPLSCTPTHTHLVVQSDREWRLKWKSFGSLASYVWPWRPLASSWVYICTV